MYIYICREQFLLIYNSPKIETIRWFVILNDSVKIPLYIEVAKPQI